MEPSRAGGDDDVRVCPPDERPGPPAWRPLGNRAASACADLVRLPKDDEIGEIVGSPQRVVRGSRADWHDACRLGGASKKRYPGEESDALLARIETWRALADARRDRDPRRARLVRVLRAEGMTPMDRETGSALAAMSRAGAFRVGGVLVGTAAFRLHEGELRLAFASEDLAQTQEIDVASFVRLPLAIGDFAKSGMDEALKELDFAPAPSLDPHRSWRLRHMRGDMMVEFLTPSFREDEDLRDLPALGGSLSEGLGMPR